MVFVEEKKLDRIHISLTADEKDLLEQLCQETKLSKSQLVRICIEVANNNRSKLIKYLEQRRSRDAVGKKKELPNLNLLDYLINQKTKELQANLLINLGRCRISIKKGTVMKRKSHDDINYLSLEANVYSRKRTERMQLMINIDSVNYAEICDAHTGQCRKFGMVPVDELGEYEFVQISDKRGDGNER